MDKFTRNTLFVLLTLFFVGVIAVKLVFEKNPPANNSLSNNINIHSCKITSDFNANVSCRFTLTNPTDHTVVYSTDFLTLEILEKQTNTPLDSPGKMPGPSTENTNILEPGKSVDITAYAYEVSRVESHDAVIRIILEPVPKEYVPQGMKSTYPDAETLAAPYASYAFDFRFAAK